MMSIPRSTRALLELCRELLPALPSLPDGSARPDCLDIASAGAAVAQLLRSGYLHDHWGACAAAQEAGVRPVYHADQLPPTHCRFIALDARELDPALTVELVGQAADRLTADGMLVTTARRADLEPWFGEVVEQGEALVARLPRPGQPLPPVYTYGLALGGQELFVRSEPGVFSPRGLDPGTREMLAVIHAEPGQRFLDLGCGVGVVSLVASQLWGCQVTAVDVSARALRLTRQNAPSATVLTSDGFAALGGQQFDLIASNPPYHTDFAVAKGFIEGAYQHLAPGGWLYLVVKRADWYERKMRSLFGGCRLLEREGYSILMAQRRSLAHRAPAPTPPRTTKKHARRMAAAARRRHP